MLSGKYFQPLKLGKFLDDQKSLIYIGEIEYSHIEQITGYSINFLNDIVISIQNIYILDHSICFHC